MALKHTVNDISTVPEAHRSLYRQHDGKYVLDVEGAVSASEHDAVKAQVVQFRDNNVALLKALGAPTPEEGLKRAALVAGIDPARLERLKAIDPEEYDKLKAQVAGLKDKGMGTPDEADAKVKALLDAALAPLRAQLDSAEKARQAAQAAADQATLRTAVGEVFIKSGGKPAALDYLLTQARDAFVVRDGRVVAAEGKFSAVKPGDPLSIAEWMEAAAKQHDFAFEPSRGGGAPGGNAPTPREGVRTVTQVGPVDMSRYDFEAGKGLVDKATRQPVQFVSQAGAAA